MYVAHTQHMKQEASRHILEFCLALFEESNTDSDRFSAILTITGHIRSSSLATDDRRTILEAVGLDFLVRLVQSTCLPPNCPPDFYKSAALSILSVWTVDPCIAQHPVMKDFLPVVNEVVTLNSPYKRGLDSHSRLIYKRMCLDSEELVSNLAKHELGVEYLIQAKTLDLMFRHSTSPSCQNVTLVLDSLSSIVKTRGEICLNLDPDTLYSMLRLTVDRLGRGSDIKEKAEFARILTSFLTGVTLVEVTIHMDWVVDLIRVLQKLVTVKMAPDDGQSIFGLVCTLVSTAGPQVLSSEVGGNYNFLKSVVALVYVEVYMLLDHMTLNDASSRSRRLDRVYKLLTTIVQFVAESGETMDSDTIIVVYRKLVQTSETIMEFLYSVANQEVEFQRNHTVVLISVRTLAAMLSEITEDVTPRLLELLPFFNLLCQNVEYSDDVIMEVQNASLAALTNIKSIDTAKKSELAVASEDELAATSLELSSSSAQTDKHSSDELLGCKDESISKQTGAEAEISEGVSDSLTAFSCLKLDTSVSDERDNDIAGIDSLTESKIAASSKLSATDGQDFKTEKSFVTIDHDDHTKVQQTENHPDNQNSNTNEGQKRLHAEICLSQESIDNFKTFQTSRPLKPQLHSSQKVSFSTKNKTSHDKSSPERSPDDSDQWKPTPNDVLGCLLPAYMCLLDNDEVLETMVRSDSFQTIVNFLKSSLSCLLENQSSGYPESTTLNALSVIEQVYTNSPASAAQLECFKELFEISILSLPNLVSLSQPPALVCLKLLEVSLSAYRLQMRDSNRKSSLPWLKHSQSRFFKASVEYLSSFYKFQQRRGKPLSLDVQDIWPLAEDLWCACVAGLCMLVRSVEELQDALAKSRMLPDFLAYLANHDGFDSCPQDAQHLTQSMFSLIEAAAESCQVLMRVVLENHGQTVARKFGLHQLSRICPSNKNKSQNKPAV